VPQGIAVDAQVARIEIQAPRPGHAAAVVEADAFTLFAGFVVELWGPRNVVRDRFPLCRQIIAQVTARHDPGAVVVVERAVDLVE
jgi:hypothetical protein